MDELIRVAQILNKMDNGGIEAVVINYYRNIDHTKVQFDFFYEEDSTLPQKQELLDLGARLYPVPPYTHIVRYVKTLKRLFVQNKYSIVHVHLNTMSVFALACAKKCNVPVRICHNHTTANWKEGKKTLLKYILRPFNQIFATDYFACGEYAGRWMYGNKDYDAGKVNVLINAIDKKKFQFNQQSRLNIRNELGISQDDFVVGHVGRFVHQKNHFFLIEVFSRVYEKRRSSYLLLVGDGELKPEIMKRVRELNIEDRVIFTGVRQDVSNIYSAMDAFCLPSLYEGMPVVGLEVQANGLPLICSTNISDEVCLSKIVKRLPLSNHQDEWANSIIDSKREVQSIPERYDIHHEAEKLLKFYLLRINN